MKIKIVLVISALIVVILFLTKNSDLILQEALLPDQNPELVTYLQGDWAVANDGKAGCSIKRDSLVKTYNGFTTNVSSLYYVFNGAASKYFKGDSSFDFSLPTQPGLSTFEFRLKEVSARLKDIEWDTLVYVSQSRLDMLSHGKVVSLRRAK